MRYAVDEKAIILLSWYWGCLPRHLIKKTVRDKYEAIPTTALYYTTCLVVFVIAVGLLVIGLWNATLLLSEKGFYGLAYFLSLFGAVAVQKNVRDAWDPTRLREPLSVTEEGPESYVGPLRVADR